MKYPENINVDTLTVIIKAKNIDSLYKVAEYFHDKVDPNDIKVEDRWLKYDSFECDATIGEAFDIAKDIAKLGINVYGLETYTYFEEEGLLPIIMITIE